MARVWAPMGDIFSSALIGSTGFVGSNLLRQREFSVAVHRTDVERLAGNHFQLLVCAGAPAEKWRANSEPDADRANLDRLVNFLGKVTAGLFVLVSTVDVYPAPQGVDELTSIDPAGANVYGRHRRHLEMQCQALFPKMVTVRLPGLFGPGLKKNFLFDLMGGRNLEMTHSDSWFQFYDVQRLWKDIQTAANANLALINLATPPMRAGDIAEHHFGIRFDNRPEAGPANYDMQTVHAAHFGASGRYVCSADTVHGQLANWIRTGKAGSVGRQE